MKKLLSKLLNIYVAKVRWENSTTIIYDYGVKSKYITPLTGSINIYALQKMKLIKDREMDL